MSGLALLGGQRLQRLADARRERRAVEPLDRLIGRVRYEWRERDPEAAARAGIDRTPPARIDGQVDRDPAEPRKSRARLVGSYPLGVFEHACECLLHHVERHLPARSATAQTRHEPLRMPVEQHADRFRVATGAPEEFGIGRVHGLATETSTSWIV